MRGDGDRGVDAERHRRQYGGRDNGAVDEIVKRVADDDDRHRRAVHLAFVGVAVAEQDEFFENEERQDAEQQRPEHRRGAKLIEGFGQQREQRDAEQSADRITHQPRNDARADALCEEQQRAGDEQTAAAAEQAQAERGREQRHATF